MARQARAESTRRRILEVAANLFSERGYGETGLTEIVEAADISTGAFYYHFASKEAVATAIVDDFDNRLAAAVLDNIDVAAPRIADLIRSTFAVQALLRWDTYVQAGQLLMQAFETISPHSRRVTVDWTEKFVLIVSGAHEAGDLLAEADPAEVGEAMWIAVLGSHVLSVTLKDSPFERLARVWRFILRTVVPQEAMRGYESFLTDLVTEYDARSPALSGPTSPAGPAATNPSPAPEADSGR